MGWASDELATIDLGDARLNRRAAALAEAFAQSPTASIPGACHDTAEVRAAYRFFDHEDVGFWDVLDPHIRSTERRMSEHALVLCLQVHMLVGYTLWIIALILVVVGVRAIVA